MDLQIKQLVVHFPTDHLLTKTFVDILNRRDILNKRLSHLTNDKPRQRKIFQLMSKMMVKDRKNIQYPALLKVN